MYFTVRVLITEGLRQYVLCFTVRYPPRVCVKMTGKVIKAYVCLDVYNVNLVERSLCTRLIGVIDFKVQYFARAALLNTCASSGDVTSASMR